MKIKSHELAKALRHLAVLLERSPNLPLGELKIKDGESKKLSTGDIAVSLSTLVELSRIDKHQWATFIRELGFPIEVRARDASRDILGKLLNYLEANENARMALKSRAASRGSEASPELMKALSSLLRD